jgi:alpha-amylase
MLRVQKKILWLPFSPLLVFVIVIFSIFSVSYSQAETRTVMVQLFQWSWPDVAKECESYLGPAGFAAVQISPPNEHVKLDDHPWWERYQPVSYKFESRSGTEWEFQDMVTRCRRAGVAIYADVVLNHMAGVDSGSGFAGSTFRKYEYPGIFSYSDFHHCGRNENDSLVNWGDLFEVQNCELVRLADLDSRSAKVQNIQAQYLNKLVSFGVLGFRVDASKHIASPELSSVLAKATGNPYVIHESIPGKEGLHYSDYLSSGDVNVFEVPFIIGRAFQERNISAVFQLQEWNSLPPSDGAVVFLENHDLQRLGSASILSFQSNPVLYRLAQIFLLAWPYGYPQIFSGYQFADFSEGPPLNKQGFVDGIFSKDGQRCRSPWLCEHRLPEVRKMVKFRNQTNDYFAASNLWSDGRERLAFGRGPLGMVLINISSETWRAQVPTQMSMGNYCNILSPAFEPGIGQACSTPSVTVDQNGVLMTNVPPQQAVVIESASLK